MPVDPNREPPPTKERAAELMSELIKREFGVEIAPWALIEFVNAKFSTLNLLSHAIHWEYELNAPRR